ncbi:sensor histidine kinase [Siccirubricoccus deserti]|uniref:histidine kinase n=1 Tax=Siccirubricoccus deserti TaxID=2013562 RepID=A0A9X0UJT9_9PROT|nr:histidine kinase dimerization/phospho-acceptor domain-containing protein [Siccirubricoccus deserti]MBC4018445.1 hypothetical protein [Siccirubricoccus deserti]
MQLLSPTRTALAFALAAVFAWLFFLIWQRDRAQPALAWWGAAHAAWAIAMLVLTFRGPIPPGLSILLGNIAIGLGYGLLWGGARLFSGLRPHWWGILAGVLLWVAGCLTPGFFDSLSMRVALSSSTIAVYSLVVALVFRAGMRRQRLPSHRATIGVLVAHGLVHAIRATGAITLGFDTSGTAAPEASWNAVVAVLAITLLACFAGLLIALAGERGALASNAVLAAARDAEARTSREKSRFLARMSHELRTPLNGVLGMAQALAQDPSLGPKQRERAATLEHAGRHLLAIVNDVLDLTRIEAGRLELLPQPVRLREGLSEALEMVRAAAVEKRMALQLELAPELPEAVLADPVRLRQIRKRGKTCGEGAVCPSQVAAGLIRSGAWSRPPILTRCRRPS